MAVFKSFKAVRPLPETAEKIAALPYDVMNSEEAREMVKGNDLSFLHVDKAEIDLDASMMKKFTSRHAKTLTRSQITATASRTKRTAFTSTGRSWTAGRKQVLSAAPALTTT